MIFVTVGTHEQSFERLIRAVEAFAIETGTEIVIQRGYTNYEPDKCHSEVLITPEQMRHYINTADLVITHGGASTYMDAISKGKPTIIVPRLSKHNEHVNDHQLEFAQKINTISDYELTIVTDVDTLKDEIENKLATHAAIDIVSNTHNFNTQLQNLLNDML